LPGLSGFALVERIRAEHWPIAAIVTTPHGEASNEIAEKLCAVLVPEPFDLAVIRRIVLTTLAERAACAKGERGGRRPLDSDSLIE
jgi:hypothetical protein